MVFWWLILTINFTALICKREAFGQVYEDFSKRDEVGEKTAPSEWVTLSGGTDRRRSEGKQPLAFPTISTLLDHQAQLL